MSDPPPIIDRRELANYLVQHYAHLLTERERLIERAIRARQKHAGMELNRPIDMSSPVTRMVMAKWGFIDDAEVNRLLADGPESFRLGVAERLLREHADDIVVNRCPKCLGLARTPRARQCLHCHHQWHLQSARDPLG